MRVPGFNLADLVFGGRRKDTRGQVYLSYESLYCLSRRKDPCYNSFDLFLSLLEGECDGSGYKGLIVTLFFGSLSHEGTNPARQLRQNSERTALLNSLQI